MGIKSEAGCFLPVFLALLLLGRERGSCQKLPTRDEDHFHFHISSTEIFYDTKLLPDGAEVSSYIFQGTDNRFHFMVEEDNTPLSITITPCGSRLEWRVSIHDLPGEGSANGPDPEDELIQQMTVAQPTRASGTILKTYNGSKVELFVQETSPAGLYVLEVRAMEADSTVLLYATTTPHSDQLHPILPTQPSVGVVSVKGHTITLMWKPSPTSTLYHQPVHYCVAVNRKHNLLTMCAAKAYIFGDVPPTAPPNAGFGFSWEKQVREEEAERWRSRSMVPIHHDAHYECLGGKTSYTFSGTKSGKDYYFDIFAVNPRTNTSTAYAGTHVKTRNTLKSMPIKDGKTKAIHVKKNGDKKYLRYDLKKKAKHLILSLQSCNGAVRMKVTRGRRVIKDETVTGLSQYTIRKARPGRYTIEITPNARVSTRVRVFVSTRSDRSPYPHLPEDKSIRVFDNLSQCNAVTLAWLILPEKQHYCLYRSRVRHGESTSWRLSSHNACSNPRIRKKRDKVGCWDFQGEGGHETQTVVTETVRNLERGTLYAFDVYVRSDAGETLSYRQTRAKTAEAC